MSGLWSLIVAIATLAGMATVIGLFNRWPAHETAISFLVAVACGLVAVFASRNDHA